MDKEIIFVGHSQEDIKEREINVEFVKDVIKNPQQTAEGYGGRKVAQSRYYDEDKKKEILIRVVYKESEKALLIITAYKTSKLKKYWRENEDQIR